MKKLLLFIAFLLTFAFTIHASPVEKFPVTLTQPDGTEIHCFVSGDEYYNWAHDGDGYTLIRDAQTGFVVYAKLQNDELVSSGYRFESVNPATVGLKPWTIVSADKRKQLRNDFLANTPQRAVNPDRGRAGQNNGTLNNLVIYIRFSDETEFAPKANLYNDMFNKDEAGYSSMYGYFKAVSHEATLIPSTFYPISSGNVIISYQDTYPRSYFQPYNAASNPNGYQGGDNGYERGVREHQLLKRAVEAVSSQIPSTLDLDYNNDGDVDNICFTVKGSPGAWASLLWPHRWALYYETVYINGKQVWDYNLLIETHLDSHGASVLSHEMFHTLSAPDLYRYSNNTIDPVGVWDLMCANATPPQSSTAYIKYKYGGWINSIPEIRTGGTYTLNNVMSPTNNAYKIASPNSSTEYFVVEYRDRSIYWESGLPGSGLLIYRVNTLVGGNSNGPPDELYIFRPGGTNNTNNGNLSSAYFSSQSGRTAFNDSTNPPCFLSNNQPGGINISNISASGGETMTFVVNMSAYIISATAGPGGTISPSGGIGVELGENVSFTFAPNPGNNIDAVLIDGANNPGAVAAGSYTFNNVMANHTIAVFFACPSQGLPMQESFNNNAFPPDCWISESASDTPWERVTSGANPTCSPHSGAGMLKYNCWEYYNGETGLLITPKIAANNANTILTFWMYRDNYGQYGGAGYKDKINIYLSPTQSITGLTPVRTIHRCRDFVPVESADGWYQYTVNLSTASMSEAYVIFEGVSDYGNNIYLDDVEVTRAEAPPVLTTFTLNNGAEFTAYPSVALNHTYTGGDPTHYMAGENESLSGANWQLYNERNYYTFASDAEGVKKVYTKLKNNLGESAVMSSEIYYKTHHPKLNITSSEEHGLKASLYPNPVPSTLNISVEDEQLQKVTVTIYSITGQLYLLQTFYTSEFNVDVSNYPAGVLLVKIASGERYVVKQVLKQ